MLLQILDAIPKRSASYLLMVEVVKYRQRSRATVDDVLAKIVWPFSAATIDIRFPAPIIHVSIV
jgi:hypothetical protein